MFKLLVILYINKLWKLQKVIYGLSNASGAWYLRVNDEFIKLGVAVSEYDKRFYIRTQNSILQGIILVHVDNFVWAGSKSFTSNVINSIKSTFKVSKENNAAFEYIGINLKITPDVIYVHQQTYPNFLVPINISEKCKKNKNIKSLSQNEMQDLRSNIGLISWLASISQPDLSFEKLIV